MSGSICLITNFHNVPKIWLLGDLSNELYSSLLEWKQSITSLLFHSLEKRSIFYNGIFLCTPSFFLPPPPLDCGALKWTIQRLQQQNVPRKSWLFLVEKLISWEQNVYHIPPKVLMTWNLMWEILGPKMFASYSRKCNMTAKKVWEHCFGTLWKNKANWRRRCLHMQTPFFLRCSLSKSWTFNLNFAKTNISL